MPVTAKACQARHLHTQHKPYMSEPNLGDQPLKAEAAFSGRARPPEIVVNDNDALTRPAELERPVDQGILQPRRLLVTLDLLRCRLTNVDHRGALSMSARNLVGQHAARRQQAGTAHRSPPCSEERLEPVAG